MKKILYIDDLVNTVVMDSRLEIIEEIGVEIIRVDSVESAMETIKANIPQISLIILDIIMPPEDIYTLEETNGGTTTGLRLLKDIRSQYPDVLIMIISIKQKRNLEGIEEVLSKYKVAEFLEKQKITVSDIADVIKKLIF